MSENKTGKYLKYAIGEIVLVMVGILLALQVNNWNQNYKNRKTEKLLLISLQDDFIKTKVNIERTLNLQNDVLNLTNALMIHYLNRNTELTIDSISEMIGNGAASFWRIEPTLGTYQGMLGNGESKLIQSELILQDLAKFYSETSLGFEDHNVSLDLIVAIMNDLGNHIALTLPPNKYIKDIEKSNNQKKSLKQELSKLYQNPSLFVKINYHLDYETNRMRWQQYILNSTNRIIDEIDNELLRWEND